MTSHVALCPPFFLYPYISANSVSWEFFCMGLEKEHRDTVANYQGIHGGGIFVSVLQMWRAVPT